jgi:hypothetical protein
VMEFMGDTASSALAGGPCQYISYAAGRDNGEHKLRPTPARQFIFLGDIERKKKREEKTGTVWVNLAQVPAPNRPSHQHGLIWTDL